MKHELFWMMCAAASISAVIIGGTAMAAPAQQQRSPITTVVGERPSDEGKSVRVSYRDLNLAAARDERILKNRVGDAARDVCEPDPTGPIGDHIYADCVSFAWNGARPQVALAVRRAKEISQFGTSSIPLVAIAISVR